MRINAVLLGITLFAAVSCGTASKVIKTKVPARPAGQENVIGLATEPIDEVRIGVVGLGMRGGFAVERLSFVPGAVVTAICDIEPSRVQKSFEWLKLNGRPEPSVFSGKEDSWKQLCERDDVDLVYICTDWLNHTPIAKYAMEHGKHTAIEVPAALNLDEIWTLINTSERTRKHCMMLENCVYDFYEMATLSMAQDGVFGEIIHCEGSYCHNLDKYWGKYWNNWRLDYNRSHRGDVYPTHGIGPICQVLNIHRGDRMKTLVSMDTRSFNGGKIAERLYGNPCDDFLNGDQTCTLISTQNGKTMLIEHDVMTPRPYSRMYQVVGTDGYAAKYPTQQYCLRDYGSSAGDARSIPDEKVYSGTDLQPLQDAHPNEILTPELVALAKKVGGHGGMDFIMDYRLVYCLRNGLPLDMDVYDLAEWCCIAPLSALSIENGNMPVEIPDFTRGAWNVIKGYSYGFAE